MRSTVRFAPGLVHLIAITAAIGAPQINSGGVVNAASYTGKLARGSLGAIFGSNFVSGSAVTQAQSLPLPLSLGGVSVIVGGVPAPLVFVSANQIDFEVPFETAGSSASVVVISGGVQSNAVSFTLADYAVGVFTDASLSPIVVHAADNSLVSSSNQAVPGESLVIYATGIGKLSRSVGTGQAAPAPAAAAVDMPTITVSGATAKVLFAGLTPGSVGLAQFNAVLPSSLPTGSLPLTIQLPGDSSAPVNLAVRGNLSTGPAISISTTVLTFGSVATGQTKDLPVTVTNTGGSMLTVTALREFGIGFTIVSPTAPFNIAPGATQNVMMRFAPSKLGSASGSLTIASNDPSSPLSIELEGSGVVPGSPEISVSPSALQFGNVVLGQTATLPVSITNNGNAALNVSSLAVTAGFTISPSAPFAVAPGNTTNVNVSFAPTALGLVTGTLTISSDDPFNGTVAVTLAATGFPFVPLACGFQLGPDIYAKWTALGGQNSSLGCPAANEVEAPKSAAGTTGRSAPFANGMIFWIRNGVFAGQAHELHGCGINTLTASGGTGGFLGFPVTDVYSVNGGIRSDFEGGYILGVSISNVCPAYRTGGDFTGLWNTTQQSMSLVQDGAQVSGTYGTGASGTISGSIASNALGIALAGNWQDGHGQIGSFAFNIAADGQSFTGQFQQLGSPVFDDWSGTRYSSPALGWYSPMRLDFGTVKVGQSMDLPLLVSNTGQIQMAVFTVTSDQGVFKQTSNLTSVTGGKSQTVTIRFTPAAAGPVSGNLTITTSDTIRPTITIPLVGVGK